MLVICCLLALLALVSYFMAGGYRNGHPPAQNRAQEQTRGVYLSGEIKPERIMAELTAYTSGSESTGKYPGHPAHGITSSGHRLTEADAFRVVAADDVYYPAGTRLYLSGVGLVTVLDTGEDIKGPTRLDLYIGEDSGLAYAWGRQKVEVMKPCHI